MQPTSLAVTPIAPGADAPEASAAPAFTLAADTRSVRGTRQMVEGSNGRRYSEVSLRVKLQNIIDALEMSSGMRSGYLHRITGKLVMLSGFERAD
jgi:hypothetical protein